MYSEWDEPELRFGQRGMEFRLIPLTATSQLAWLYICKIRAERGEETKLLGNQWFIME